MSCNAPIDLQRSSRYVTELFLNYSRSYAEILKMIEGRDPRVDTGRPFYAVLKYVVAFLQREGIISMKLKTEPSPQTDRWWLRDRMLFGFRMPDGRLNVPYT